MSSLLDFEDKPFSELNDDDDLLHYGILGMKWGVRRDRRTLDRLAGRDKELKTTKYKITVDGPDPDKAMSYLDDLMEKDKAARRKALSSQDPSEKANERAKTNAQVRRERKAAKNDRRTLELKELKERIERLKLDTELAKLTNDDLAPVRTFMARIMKDIAQQTLKSVGTTVATGLLTYAVRAALEKKAGGSGWDPAEAAKYLMPKKK